MRILEELETNIEKVQGLQNILVSHATGGSANDSEYQAIRNFLVSDEELRPILPKFLITNRDLNQFWQFIKGKFSTYAERRTYIYQEFQGLMDILEGVVPGQKGTPKVTQNYENSGPIKDPECHAITQPTIITEEYHRMPKVLTHKTEDKTIDRTKVFIVHGHDDLAKVNLARYIEQLGLEPIILHEQASTSKTIIEKIEAYSNVGFAVVLYTPCDVGSKASNEPELKPRGRQNVVFEHGYFIGKLGRSNVTALVKGNIETPNDISGVVYIDLDARGAWRLDLAKEMKAAGYEIDMSKVI